jgi:hypothetical protein
LLCVCLTFGVHSSHPISPSLTLIPFAKLTYPPIHPTRHPTPPPSLCAPQVEAERAGRALADASAQKSAHSLAELRSRVEVAEHAHAHESRARREATKELDEVRRAAEQNRAAFETEAAKLRALERRIKLETGMWDIKREQGQWMGLMG